MDLLEGTAGNFMISKAKRHQKPGQEAAKFRTDEDTRKMIITDSESNEDAMVNSKTSRTPSKPSIDDQLAGAYKDSVDGLTRDPNGTIKFHKDTKKRRKEEMETGDMEIEIDTLEDHISQGWDWARTNEEEERCRREEGMRKSKSFHLRGAMVGSEIKHWFWPLSWTLQLHP